MAETPLNETQLVPLQEEKSPRTGVVSWDYRLAWMALAVIIAFVGFSIASRVGMTALAILWAVLVILLAIVFVYAQIFDGLTKTSLTMVEETGERMFLKATGDNRFVGQDAAIGDMFDSADKPVELVAERKYSKLVGKLVFTPHEVDPDVPPVGIVYDRRMRGFSVTFWVAGTPLTHMTEEEKRRRETAFAHTLDAMNPLGSNVGRIAWRTQTLLSEPIDTDLIREVVGRKDGGVRDLRLLDDVATELSRSSVRPVTTMTLTVHKQDLRHQKRKAGGYETALWEEARRFMQVARDETTLFASASALTYNQLIGMTRLIADPVYVERMNPRLMDESAPGVVFNPRLALPSYFDFEPNDMAQAGNTVHAYFYVTTQEQRPVTRDDFVKIHSVKVPKTITNVVQLLSRSQAIRRAGFSANAAYSGMADKEASGERVSGTAQFMAEQSVQAERDLIRGKHMYERERFYVDITGDSLAQCAAHVAVFEREVAQSNLVLVPYLGRQSEGFRATLPIGAGLEAIPLPKSMLK